MLDGRFTQIFDRKQGDRDEKFFAYHHNFPQHPIYTSYIGNPLNRTYALCLPCYSANAFHLGRRDDSSF